MPLLDPDQERSRLLEEFNKTEVPSLADFDSRAFLDLLSKVWLSIGYRMD